MDTHWHLVLNRNGTVLGATDGAPAAWIGTRLDDRDDVPEDLKEAGRRLLDGARHSPAPAAASVLIQPPGQPVHLSVVDALPLLRGSTDLRVLLQSALEVMQRQAKGSEVTLTVIVDDHVPAIVLLDAEKIAWATTVLVGSSLRYVHHGSRAMPGGSITVRVTCDPAGPAVMIEVQDDGPGISIDSFPFRSRLGADRPRVGLGLAMVREVVDAHGGHVDVHSDTDVFRHGTTIRLTLPVS